MIVYSGPMADFKKWLGMYREKNKIRTLGELHQAITQEFA